jgi:hypothetical protein
MNDELERISSHGLFYGTIPIIWLEELRKTTKISGTLNQSLVGSPKYIKQECLIQNHDIQLCNSCGYTMPYQICFVVTYE